MVFTHDTFLTKELNAAESKVQYDEHAKRILCSRQILAWILKGALKEFQNLSVQQIAEECILELSPISTVPVSPGLTNTQLVPEAITGLSTESRIPGEGLVTFDIRLAAAHPSRKKLFVNIEAQRAYYHSYEIPTRGIFYGSRMISSQMDTEFREPHYEDLKKVYSIWLCMNAPEYVGDAACEYWIQKRELTGKVPSSPESFDKLSVIQLCFCSNVEPVIPVDGDGNIKKLLCLLHVIFTTKITVNQKLKILEQKFEIASRELKGDLETMCNFSDAIEYAALKQGISQGISTSVTILKNLNISDDVIQKQLVENFKITEEAAQAALAGN